MPKCISISDCDSPGSCFGTFGACLKETTDERRAYWCHQCQQARTQGCFAKGCSGIPTEFAAIERAVHAQQGSKTEE